MKKKKKKSGLIEGGNILNIMRSEMWQENSRRDAKRMALRHKINRQKAQYYIRIDGKLLLSGIDNSAKQYAVRRNYAYA